ncbi:AAA family ATPase [Halorubrum vacuolatum]|uniref:AAA ATPase domain-containing protein n=1 Tax=Halorubrum vacuolatum TaxID=63740 RepID=A0A238W993_HALVU|nr:ATP-binding protein [Halorubrum vacuolatum]SNR43165.1 AAA ATPase domain-containing protein [Halorubrum vacuolatum]
MTENGVSSSDAISRPEEEIIAQYIEHNKEVVHIVGEPGVGKTTVLDHIEEELDGEIRVDRRNIQANHNLDELFRKLCRALFNALPEGKKEEGRKFAGLSVSTPIGGGGVSFESHEAEASRAQFGYKDSLLGLSDLFPEDQSLIVCVDDVHELSEDKRKVQGAIQEAAEELPSNVILITAGRLALDEIDATVSLSMFTEEQTITFLQNATDVTTEDAHAVHDQLGGHPLYLGLQTEANSDDDLLDIPEKKIQKEIKRRYFEFLTADERRLLLATASLEELNEELCTRVASRAHGFDRVKVGEILDSLNTRTVVQTLGTNADGLQIFKVHDVFRDFLEARSDHTETAHVGACVYHAEKLIKLVDDHRTFEIEINHVTSWISHLSESTLEEEQDLLTDLIETTISDEGLRFYPSSILLDEFKQHDPAELPDTIVKAILSSVETSCNMANHFYDRDLDPSWVEFLFEEGKFTDPHNNLITYLGRTAETRPSFVQQVAQELETDNLRTQRFFLSLSRDLPVNNAAVVGQQALTWVQDDEAYGYLGSYAIRLASYLIEHDEYDVALEILDVMLMPREGNQLDVDQGMIRYNLTELFDEHFDELLQERGGELLGMFTTNLITALQQRTEEEEKYGTVADQISFADLNFVENKRGSLAEILLDYSVQAMTAWVNINPTSDQKTEFVEWLLDQHTVLQRIGLYVLSEFPEAFVTQISDEVTNEQKYHEQQSHYEFYLAFEKGYEHLDHRAQQRVCGIIENGPYADDVENRAERLAAREEESASYFEQRIREKWKRDRFYLIRDYLDDPYIAQLDELLEKHGEPDRPPSRGRQPVRMHGGVVRQYGPEKTDKLRDQPAEEVLTTAVKWEPPESERWNTGETVQLEERSHRGFSSQLGELIKEDPQRYAREISVLEDAHSQYAEAAFRAFRDLIDDGETFPWDSILALGQAITTSPTAWSERSKTNLAMLINRGIAADTTAFPDGFESQIEDVLSTLSTDPDPVPERDQPAEGMAGHGDPATVAINSVRPMAVNAYITYLAWKDEQTETQLDELFFDPIEERILEDQSLAVRSVIGRRFGTLYRLNTQFIKDHLDDIFTRGTDQPAQRQFIAAWNSYTAYNRYWDSELFREYYFHALSLLDADKDAAYQIEARSTTAHVASIYLFENDDLSDDESLINHFYHIADREAVKELASTLASSMGNEEVEDQWSKIRDLWEYRLNVVDPDTEDHDTEIRYFLDCVRSATTTTLKDEESRILQSLPFVAKHTHHWRRIEGWLAEQAADCPVVTIKIYDELVDAVTCGEWSSIARTSQEDHRSYLYECAEDAGEEALQTALDIADQFAAENNKMDTEFLESHLPI